MEKIVHLCQRQQWEAARRVGVYRPASLESEGFIHCSRPEQIGKVAQRFYRQLPDLVLLWIDPPRVQPKIRWEAADGETFPHIYGPLNLDAVIAIQEYDVESGKLFPPDMAPVI